MLHSGLTLATTSQEGADETKFMGLPKQKHEMDAILLLLLLLEINKKELITRGVY
jgi:hypothetical protein